MYVAIGPMLLRVLSRCEPEVQKTFTHEVWVATEDLGLSCDLSYGITYSLMDFSVMCPDVTTRGDVEWDKGSPSKPLQQLMNRAMGLGLGVAHPRAVRPTLPSGGSG